MIKMIESYDTETLEELVNNWIRNCGCNIHDIQFRTIKLEDYIVFHCCIITEFIRV